MQKGTIDQCYHITSQLMFYSVTAKLRELGYTNDDWNIPDDFSFRKERKEWIKLVYQKRELTDRSMLFMHLPFHSGLKARSLQLGDRYFQN